MFDIYYLILVLPAILFAMWASSKVNSTYRKYEKVYNSRGITGAQAARMVLDSNGLTNVRIEHIAGQLTDHYDPKANVIRLSDSVYLSNSTAAVGVACHEAGHAIQYAENYAPIKIRAMIVPITNIGSRLAMPLIILGIVLSALSLAFYNLIYVGIACFGLSALFQLITLPTEFNASRRAIDAIESNGVLLGNEIDGAKKVLTAAALTYVAALAVSLTQLLRLLLIFGGRRKN
jgi:Zn-dependent membrane protease YugP